jgi:uncharacterized membrane protein
MNLAARPSIAFLLAAAFTSIQERAQSMTDLGTLPGGNESEARGVSADGSVVVGRSDSTNGTRALLCAHRVTLDVQD